MNRPDQRSGIFTAPTLGGPSLGDLHAVLVRLADPATDVAGVRDCVAVLLRAIDVLPPARETILETALLAARKAGA